MSTIPLPNFTSEEIENLVKEVAVLSTLDHPSLLKFIGYSSVNFKREPKPTIITESVLKQTLEGIIEMNRKGIKSINWDSTRILMNIFGIASAMSYLHSKDVIHGDLKPASIFIGKDFLPKLSDYGFYTKYQVLKSMSCQSSSRMKNVPNYSAPEILNSQSPSKESDVYSFALIIYELMTKEKPFSHLKTTNEIFFEVVARSGRPKFPEEEEEEEEVPCCFREMIEACWSQEPKQRPSFEQIVHVLKTDKRFLNNGVNEEEFFKYVDMIEHNGNQSQHEKIIENKFQKIEEENKIINSSEKVNPTQILNGAPTADLSAAYAEIRENGGSTNWILAGFNSALKNWEFFGKGAGGIEEMKESIPTDFIGYCYLRTETQNRGINRTFFILIKFVPPDTKMMTKALMNTKRGEIESIFSYSNIVLEVGSKEEISNEINKNLK